MRILAQLPKIKELPTLPEIMLKVQSHITSNEASVDKLAEIIKQDPALSSTIFKTANSAFYNIINRRLSSVKEGIARIGFNEVLKITLGMSVIKQFRDTGGAIDYKSFWRHSLAAAGITLIVADMIEGEYSTEDRQNLYLAGLLHDIGILIYDQFFHDDFIKIVNYASTNEKTFLAAEETVAPKETHAFIGGALIELWRLTYPVIGSVRYHHLPMRAPENLKKMVAVVYLAEYILCNSNIGSFEGHIREIDGSVKEFTGITSDLLDALYLKAGEETGKVESFLSLGMDYQYTKGSDNKDSTDQTFLKTI